MADVPPETVSGPGGYAVGNNGAYFTVSRRCRHLGADLAGGSIDSEGCLFCPWHQSRYDVTAGESSVGLKEYSPGSQAWAPGSWPGAESGHFAAAPSPRSATTFTSTDAGTALPRLTITGRQRTTGRLGGAMRRATGRVR